MESTLDSNSTTVQDSHSDTVSFYTAKSFDDLWMHDECKSAPPAGILQTVRPASLPTVPLPAFLPTVRPVSVPTAPPLGLLPILRSTSVQPLFTTGATGSTVSVHTPSGVETV